MKNPTKDPRSRHERYHPRTAVVTLLTLLLPSLIGGTAAADVPPLTSTAGHAAVYDPLYGQSGALLFGVKPDERTPMASTTKVWTAHLVLKAYYDLKLSLGETVTVSATAAATGGSLMRDNCACIKEVDSDGKTIWVGRPLEAGEKVLVLFLLYGLMIPSGNNAAVALAEHVAMKYGYAPTEVNFVKLMNDHAAAHGLKDTHFTGAPGFDDPCCGWDGDPSKLKHYTTARELAVMMDHASEDPTFRGLVSPGTHQFTTQAPSGVKTYSWTLTSPYPGYEATKSGVTTYCVGVGNPVGYGCNAMSATRLGRRLVTAYMQGGAAPGEAISLLDFGFPTLFHPDPRGDSGDQGGPALALGLACLPSGKAVTAVVRPSQQVKLQHWSFDGQGVDLLGTDGDNALAIPQDWEWVKPFWPPGPPDPPWSRLERLLSDVPVQAGSVEAAVDAANGAYGAAADQADALAQAARRASPVALDWPTDLLQEPPALPGLRGLAVDADLPEPPGPGDVFNPGVPKYVLAPEVKVARLADGTLVTAARLGTQVEITTWFINVAGIPVLMQGGMPAGAALEVDLQPLAGSRFILGTRALDDTVSLRAYDVQWDGSLVTAGTFTAPKAEEIALSGKPTLSSSIHPQLLLASRTHQGELRLATHAVAASGTITQDNVLVLPDDGDRLSLASVPLWVPDGGFFSINRYAVAMRLSGDQLKIVLLEVDLQHQLRKVGEVAPVEAGIADDVALARLGRNGLTAAVRDDEGHLRLVVYEYRTDQPMGTPFPTYRIVDHVDAATPSRGIALCELGTTKAEGDYLTAFRDGGDLKVSAWRVADKP